MKVKQIKTIVFDKEEKETFTKAAEIIGLICAEVDEECSHCPFHKMCDVSDPTEVISKLGHEGQLIIKD